MIIEMSAFETLETVNRCRKFLERFPGCIDRLTANDLAHSLSHESPTCFEASA